MALQLGALREALIEGGTSPEKASKAAEELAGYDSDLKLLKWMVGGVYAVLVVFGVPATLLVAAARAPPRWGRLDDPR